MLDFYATTIRTQIAVAVPVPRRDVHVHARDGRRAGDLPRRLDDDRATRTAAPSAASASASSPRTTSSGRSSADDERRLHAVRVGVSGSARASSRRSCCGRSTRCTTTSAGSRARSSRGSSCTLPIAIGLSLVFHPTLDPRPLEIVVFLVAIWGAYVIRSLNHFVLGMVTIWTTRAGAIFQLWFLRELLLSGRLVPLTLMPHWAQSLTSWLPFKWTFYFPIESLVGDMSTARAARRARHAGALDRGRRARRVRAAGGSRCGTTRRSGTDARASSRRDLHPPRHAERDAVPRELLRRALPVGPLGRRRPRRAGARLLAHARR